MNENEDVVTNLYNTYTLIRKLHKIKHGTYPILPKIGLPDGKYSVTISYN